MTVVELPSLPDAAVAKLTDIVGEGGVIVDLEGIDEFRDPYWVPGDIKDAVDPNGVLSPDRHGIWPSGYGPDGRRA